MASSSIEWTDKTWNPITGCTKISDGCKHCYAEVMAKRLQGMGKPKYINGFSVTLHNDALNEPLQWSNPCMIFVCSMSDLFHSDVPFDFIDKVFGVIRNTPQHNYQILTKRAERMAEYFASRTIPGNVWIGVTDENPKAKNRIDYIRNLKAYVRLISCEHLLEDMGELELSGINWIIVGGERGVQAGHMKEAWALNVQGHAGRRNIPFFFKQWGTWSVDGIKGNKKINGKLLQGKIVQNMPNAKKHEAITK